MEKLYYRGITIYTAQGKITCRDQEADLTKNEMKILTVLVSNAGRIVPRNDLMNELWQSDEFVDDNTLTVNVNRLRRKLDDIGAPDLISTKRGQGYMI